MIKKECAICGKVNLVSDDKYIDKFVTTNTPGAKLYFDLWHFNIESCESCGYASMDISKCENTSIKYVSKESNPIYKALNDVRTNKIVDYIHASKYYEMLGDKKYQALCLIQAGDMVYSEIMYWKEYILTEDEEIPELYELGEKLYGQGIESLREYLDSNPNDIDMKIVLVGVMLDSKDKSLGFSVLQNLKKLPLSNDQKLILDFLSNEIY